MRPLNPRFVLHVDRFLISFPDQSRQRSMGPRIRTFVARYTVTVFFTLALLAFGTNITAAQTTRLVVIRFDGLPHDTVDRFVHERDPRTGKSQLPWIEHIFYERGTRLANFYVRGMSLSGPSWSLLETGQHLQIKGNVEFDRNTLDTYNYLNFFPFLLDGARRIRVDTLGAEVLDSVGIPLFTDSYPYRNRYAGFSLYQRGTRFATFANGFLAHFDRPPRELFDEWSMGLALGGTIEEGMLKELTERLNDPSVRYLSLISEDFDHTAHHHADRESQLAALKRIDQLLGRVNTAIAGSPLASQTALVIVSDHGTNSDEQVFSQGYSLVKFLGSPSGGGHHVGTQRRLLQDYAIKGLDPFVPLITTSSPDSYYLKGESEYYPTALLDFDGNERASVHLRDSDLNALQILLQQLQSKRLSPQLENAAREAFYQLLERRRTQLQRSLDSLNEELSALRRNIVRQRLLWQAQPKKFTKADEESGRDDDVRRILAQLNRWTDNERRYSHYTQSLSNLLSLRRDTSNLTRIKIEHVIPKRSMGDRNSIHRLQNYVVGISPNGLQTKADGALDIERSFLRLDYFSLLHGITVRNNVQPQIGNRPVDFIATCFPSQLVRQSLGNAESSTQDAVWIYVDQDHQAVILARENVSGQYSFRYQPVRALRQDTNGAVEFETIPWQADLPLKLFEDQRLHIPEGDRAAWLSQWHTEEEWLKAIHLTQYSNGLIGLYEELAHHKNVGKSADDPQLSDDDRLMRRFVQTQRQAIETDILIVANNHWNFNASDFNPGGNHGSFFRASTHSTWMISGGERTGIPRGLVVDEPYDSLSFVPTLMALTGRLHDDLSPVPDLWDKGFRPFPGRVVREVLQITPIEELLIGKRRLSR